MLATSVFINYSKACVAYALPRITATRVRYATPTETGEKAILDNFILLGACFVFGILLRQSGRLPDNAPAALNGFVVNISLPALTLLYVHALKLNASLFIPALMPWLLFAIGGGFFYTLGRFLKLQNSTVGALTLTGGLGNTSFIGLPMIESFYGSQGLGTGILIDQAGSYLVLSTVGIVVASLYGAPDSRPTPASVFRKITTFPPFIAFIVALLLIPLSYPSWFNELLRRLGATLVPIALVSVGYQIQWSAIHHKLRPLAFGLMFKLIAAPALMGGVFIALFGLRGEVVQITVFEAAMPPMIGAAIIALEYDLDPPLVTLMVGIGIPLSFATIPLWELALRPFA
jgi:malate permease and related proteins